MRTKQAQDYDFEDRVKELICLGDASWVLEWVHDNFEPDDVYREVELIEWATAHGFERLSTTPR